MIVANIDSIKSIIIDNSNSLKLIYNEHFYAFVFIFFSSYIFLTSLSIPIALLLGLLAGFVMDLLVAVVVVLFIFLILFVVCSVVVVALLLRIVNNR